MKDAHEIKITLNDAMLNRLKELAEMASEDAEHCSIQRYASELVEVGILERSRREGRNNE
jgi:hypothetical protein